MVFSLASLLVKCGWSEILPGEKRQRPRWRSGRWHQQWPSWCFLFFLAQVSQYSVDSFLIFNAGNDPDSPAAATTDLNIDFKDPLELLCPSHCRMALSR